ncbi:MAG: citrate lyase ACP [Bacteroidetes bacterium]|jgi:citrate lyase subunit beta / citryl-CoA lyase|nr:citrate lyase ACP [Bacteroidota bacterium]MBT6685459.1 citrate lyase ACP [Bacteroidota bacterium]MBT7144402.1 citrate lyase ACP [Bacteroidota bacterium]MBT7490544.1 citrate lyase ACP [Bacteroidota bacterium]
MNRIASAGNKGEKVRSDCFVSLELKNSGGIKIDLKSKVKVLFGDSIIQLCKDILKYFEIENALLTVEDTGALPFVIAARVEAAVKQLIETEKEYLLEMIPENEAKSKKDQFRFSRLYLPGNSPSMMINAGIHNPNGIILDLEDSVAPLKKAEARFLVRNALRQVNFYGAERMVRINQGEAGLSEIDTIVKNNVNCILVPKCESADYMRKCEEKLLNKEVYFMPIIESALGVEKAFEIATASKNIVALAIGLEDLTADLGTKRTKAGDESLYARTRIVNASKAAGIQAIDSVYSDVGDMEGLRENVRVSKSLGFEGMGCIHPRQISIIHESFAPEADEIVKAKRIVAAFIDAEKKGLGVVSLGTKMIDPPVVKRAEKTINLAINLGLIAKNWNQE